MLPFLTNGPWVAYGDFWLSVRAHNVHASKPETPNYQSRVSKNLTLRHRMQFFVLVVVCRSRVSRRALRVGLYKHPWWYYWVSNMIFTSIAVAVACCVLPWMCTIFCVMLKRPSWQFSLNGLWNNKIGMCYTGGSVENSFINMESSLQIFTLPRRVLSEHRYGIIRYLNVSFNLFLIHRNTFQYFLMVSNISRIWARA